MPLDVALREGLSLLAAEPEASLRHGVLSDLLLLAQQLEEEREEEDEGQERVEGILVRADSLLELYRLLGAHGDPVARHLGFMLVQRVLGQPATLYR